MESNNRVAISCYHREGYLWQLIKTKGNYTGSKLWKMQELTSVISDSSFKLNDVGYCFELSDVFKRKNSRVNTMKVFYGRSKIAGNSGKTVMLITFNRLVGTEFKDHLIVMLFPDVVYPARGVSKNPIRSSMLNEFLQYMDTGMEEGSKFNQNIKLINEKPEKDKTEKNDKYEQRQQLTIKGMESNRIPKGSRGDTDDPIW